jgi:hypothetical protein
MLPDNDVSTKLVILLRKRCEDYHERRAGDNFQGCTGIFEASIPALTLRDL